MNRALDIFCFLTWSCATGGNNADPDAKVSPASSAEIEELPQMEVDSGVMLEGGEEESLEDDVTLQIERSRMECDAVDAD